jgi:hypothetical protein
MTSTQEKLTQLHDPEKIMKKWGFDTFPQPTGNDEKKSEEDAINYLKGTINCIKAFKLQVDKTVEQVRATNLKKKDISDVDFPKHVILIIVLVFNSLVRKNPTWVQNYKLDTLRLTFYKNKIFSAIFNDMVGGLYRAFCTSRKSLSFTKFLIDFHPNPSWQICEVRSHLDLSLVLNGTLSPALASTLRPALTPTLSPALVPTLSPALAPILSPALVPNLRPALASTLSPALTPTLSPVLASTLSSALIPTLSPKKRQHSDTINGINALINAFDPPVMEVKELAEQLLELNRKKPKNDL